MKNRLGPGFCKNLEYITSPKGIKWTSEHQLIFYDMLGSQKWRSEANGM